MDTIYAYISIAELDDPNCQSIELNPQKHQEVAVRKQENYTFAGAYEKDTILFHLR